MNSRSERHQKKQRKLFRGKQKTEEDIRTKTDHAFQADLGTDQFVANHQELPEEIEDLQVSMDPQEEAEFNSFFKEVLNKLPKKPAELVAKGVGTTKLKAEKMVAATSKNFNGIFDEFLKGVDEETRKKSYRIIHSAAVTAAIIGFTPIPFADAVLLVPVQLTMMARLHKLFGQSWTEGVAKSFTKELVVVSLGRSAVGNLMKLIPAAGTVAGGAVNATVALAITETLGWVTVKMLNDGEDIFEDVMSFKGQFSTLFKAIQRKK